MFTLLTYLNDCLASFQPLKSCYAWVKLEKEQRKKKGRKQIGNEDEVGIFFMSWVITYSLRQIISTIYFKIDSRRLVRFC